MLNTDKRKWQEKGMTRPILDAQLSKPIVMDNMKDSTFPYFSKAKKKKTFFLDIECFKIPNKTESGNQHVMFQKLTSTMKQEKQGQLS